MGGWVVDPYENNTTLWPNLQVENLQESKQSLNSQVGPECGNKDVLKKLELKILWFGRMADIFAMTKNFCDRRVKIFLNLFIGVF